MFSDQVVVLTITHQTVPDFREIPNRRENALLFANLVFNTVAFRRAGILRCGKYIKIKVTIKVLDSFFNIVVCLLTPAITLN
ncbi:hypothetical protein C443_05684 [Haloarcula argentinensis DSM 12282]|nr:hypothetical protein C443_05684 [Haloarcula argentinensis DSM 12282]